ncbi:MAG: ABC transporter permease subunit [Verrucomicrobiota bacterium]|jgi:hypothetical protein
MNPLVKKEIRLLLPTFAIACVLALSNLLLPQKMEGLNGILWAFPFLLCPAAVVMLALNSFGVEMSSGTFSTLLAQPVSRQKIWQTKILLLAVSLFIIAVLYSATVLLRTSNFHRSSAVVLGFWFNQLAPVSLFGLAAFSGGLWTVLLLRQVAAAFWFTILVPGAILMLFAALAGNMSDEAATGVVTVILGLYSLSGLFFARWLFFRAQDAQWFGGTIALPEVRGLGWWGKSRTTGAGSSVASPHRSWRPRMALYLKELQLHQSQFVIAGALVLLHLGVILGRKLGHIQRNSTTELILESFWGLWLVMPFLVGCAAVAEERKLGTHEGQLCLPPKRRTQFSVKLFVVLALSILFGTIIPLFFEGTRVLPHSQILLFDAFRDQSGGVLPKFTTQTFLFKCIVQINGLLPLLTLVGMAAGIGAVSFYVSTLARNTLQALGPAALGLIAAGSLIASAWVQTYAIHPLWRGWLIYFIAVPVVLLAMLALACRNFRCLELGWKLWLRNLLVLVVSLALAVSATTAIYHRFWEKLTPFEPPHGAARMKLSNPATLSERWAGISIRLPDGKVWIGNQLMPVSISASPIAFALDDSKATLNPGSFLAGSNWAMVKRAPRECVGIKTDGTLWVSQSPWQNGREHDEAEMRHLVQFGTQSNWSSLQPAYLSVLLVKTDGTLWRWGPANFDFREHKQWPGLRTFTPYRLGTESNWAGFIESDYGTYLRKIDGSFWTQYYGDWNTNRVTMLGIGEGLTLFCVAGPGHGDFRSMAQVRRGLEYQVGIRDDGTFRIWADRQELHSPRKGVDEWKWTSTDLPIGAATNWLAVASAEQTTVTLKNDGSLWLWDFFWNPRRGWDPDRDERELQQTIPIRLGTHSDWIAIASGLGQGEFGGRSYIISLAADGGLWYWPVETPRYHYNDDVHFEPLLDISHKPQFLGNVFGSGY